MAELQWHPLRFQEFYKSMIGEEIWAIMTEQFSPLIFSSPTDDNYLQSKSPLKITKHECGCDQRFRQITRGPAVSYLLLLGEVKHSAGSGINTDL